MDIQSIENVISQEWHIMLIMKKIRKLRGLSNIDFYLQRNREMRKIKPTYINYEVDKYSSHRQLTCLQRIMA